MTPSSSPPTPTSGQAFRPSFRRVSRCKQFYEAQVAYLTNLCTALARYRRRVPAEDLVTCSGERGARWPAPQR